MRHNMFFPNDLWSSLASENRFAEYGDSVFDTASPAPRIKPPAGPKSNRPSKNRWLADAAQHMLPKRLVAEASERRPFCRIRCDPFVFDNAQCVPKLGNPGRPAPWRSFDQSQTLAAGDLLDDR
jgi:hypothetical protein